jgi:hypothetical protein
MHRPLLLLASFLLLLFSFDAEARPRQPDPRRPGVHKPHRPPPGLHPRPGRRPPCGAGSCSLNDTVGDLQNITDSETSSALESGGGDTGALGEATNTGSASDATSLSDFPNDDSHANVLAMLEFAAEEYGIPLDLLMATAWTESRWTQWSSGSDVLVGGGVDYGLMQINVDTWDSTYDWSKIEGDVRENIRAGAEILKWSYDYARDRGYTGKRLAQAAYAVYNGGPDSVNRPWDTSSPWRQNDLNFESYYDSRPWESNS